MFATSSRSTQIHACREKPCDVWSASSRIRSIVLDSMRPPAGAVVEGYGVLQPRVTPSLPTGREGSLFQRTFSSMTGIDPYGAAVSDVYQDLFGEGSYAGKGIYDIDAFEAALANRVPTGSLLSHDLFEGTFARAGLASDIEVIEEFPARYDVAAARNHRWVRGDWQLLPWLFGRPDAARRGTGSLPLLGQWKMLDNLRRSLSAPTALLALLTGWLLPLHAALDLDCVRTDARLRYRRFCQRWQRWCLDAASSLAVT